MYGHAVFRLNAGHRGTQSVLSAWPIHGQRDKMKSFESNLKDNRLLLYPEVDQCWVGAGRPEERYFPSSSTRDEATCPSIIKIIMGQWSLRASVSASMILPVCALPFLSSSHWLSLPPSRERWKILSRKRVTIIISQQRGGAGHSQCLLTDPWWWISQIFKEEQEGGWLLKMLVKSVRHKTQPSIHGSQTLPECQKGRGGVLYFTGNCCNVMEMYI